MHELPVTKSICDIVLRHATANGAAKVVAIQLEIGALSDLQNEWVQRYFDYVSRGTVAEGAELDITKVPAVFSCNRCGRRFAIGSLAEEGIACGPCGAEDVQFVSGREYLVKGIEVI
jgi:hydrogenase nickel incorporation protein HypA/HybF